MHVKIGYAEFSLVSIVSVYFPLCRVICLNVVRPIEHLTILFSDGRGAKYSISPLLSKLFTGGGTP